MSQSQLSLFEHRTGAIFSPCRSWRYQLWRRWSDTGGMAAFVGLNPSTADETKNDPTIRRCISFAKSWGCGGLYMLNIFAYRATDPAEMKRQDDPVGPDNDKHLCDVAAHCRIIVACWGVHGAYLGRGADVRSMLSPLKCLGTTKDGHPRHPLYLPKSAELENY